MSVSLDTNVLVRLFVVDNQAQNNAALTCLEKYDDIRISDVALIETVYALAHYYNLGREAAAAYVKKLINLPNLTCNVRLFEKALSYFVNHPALSIEDCYMAVRAELDDSMPLFTFDKKLANQLPQARLLTTGL